MGELWLYLATLPGISLDEHCDAPLLIERVAVKLHAELFSYALAVRGSSSPKGCYKTWELLGMELHEA